jgi:glyoxylase-like metal-dependent hydrolase (beta-lactamase superfamily II)
VRLWSVEGNRQWLDGGAMFGNVPRNLWAQWLVPDEQNRLQFACRCLLVEDLDGRTVLFETGIGAFFNPKMRARYGVLEDEHVLLRSLAARGIAPEDIDAVVLSHLHFDHAGGLLTAYDESKTPELLFPRARYVIGKAAWERARSPHFRDRASYIAELPDLLQRSRRLELVDRPYSTLLGEAVRFEFSDGHTPGLMLSEIGGEGGVAFCSDLIPGPLRGAPDRREAAISGRQDRAARAFVLHARSRVRRSAARAQCRRPLRRNWREGRARRRGALSAALDHARRRSDS